MLLSSETIHSGFSCLIMACSKGYFPVLILMRVWAIWGTRRQVTKILAWSYVIYCFMQLGGAMWALHRHHIC